MKAAYGWFAVALAIAIIGVYGILASKPKGDDSTQIRAALESAIRDGKDGQAGGALDLLAQGFKLNGEAQDRAKVAGLIQKWKPEMTVGDGVPQVFGDAAQLTADTTLKVSAVGQNMSIVAPQVTYDFHKEPDHVFFVIPIQRWRLTDIVVPDSTLRQVEAAAIFGGSFP